MKVTSIAKYLLLLLLFPQFISAQGRDKILLCFPLNDFFSEYRHGTIYYNKLNPDFGGSSFSRLADTLPKLGFNYASLPDFKLDKMKSANGLLKAEGITYGAMLLPGCKYFPYKSFLEIIRMAKKGAIIIVYEKLPENVSDFVGIQKKNDRFRRMKSEFVFRNAGEHALQAEVGKGRILLGDNIGELLYNAETGLRPVSASH